MDSVLLRVKQTIVDALLLDTPAEAIGDDDDLNATLGIDSVGFLQILTSLEETFGVEFEDVQLSRQKFNTPRRLAKLVVRAQVSKEPGA